MDSGPTRRGYDSINDYDQYDDDSGSGSGDSESNRRPSNFTVEGAIDAYNNEMNDAQQCDDLIANASSSSSSLVWVIFLVVILLGPINFVLYKLMYVAFDDDEQYFVSQTVNVQYCVIGGLALFMVRDQLTSDMHRIDHRKFIIMGSLDCLAGFMGSCGAKYTSGATQQLLNQSLIPLTMLASWIFLKRTPSPKQVLGAVIILLGVVVVILPNMLSSQRDARMASPLSSITITSQIIYFSSNIPYALSFCYKEYAFRHLSIHVILLTQWVSLYQFMIGFLLAPVLSSINGDSVSDTYQSFQKGFQCFIGSSGKDTCRNMEAFYYLSGYVTVNFIFNTLGLYLVKHGSATLNSISYAIILPLTTLTFTLPWLGAYKEHFNINIISGLVLVLVGFFVWKLSNDDMSSQPPSMLQLDAAAVNESSGVVTRIKIQQEPVFTFNERTIVPVLVKKQRGHLGR